MLTADLVDTRTVSGELVLRPFDKRHRQEALAIAGSMLATVHAEIGSPRAQVERSLLSARGEDGGPRRRKLALGIEKLVTDACVFEQEEGDPVTLRRELFRRAAVARREGTFVREALVTGVDERALFSDLRSEHLLRRAPMTTAEAIVEAYDLGRAQAVLLAAVRVSVDLTSSSAGPLRAFFSKLKFHELLFTAERKDNGFRIVIDGPFSIVDEVTRYGLRLALVLPALRELDAWSLCADVRWGKAKTPLVFRARSERRAKGEAGEPLLADDVRTILDDLRALGAEATPASTFLDVPGFGVVVPDLVVDGVFVEVLGPWSRDAAFKRAEIAPRLPSPVVFAANAKLRVSPEIFAPPSALYVFRGRMNARSLYTLVKRAR